jgi:hypothetical protein
MRAAAAIGVVAVALTAAVRIHERTHIIVCDLGPILCMRSGRSSWQDPVAVLIAVGGIALAAFMARRYFANLA